MNKFFIFNALSYLIIFFFALREIYAGSLLLAIIVCAFLILKAGIDADTFEHAGKSHRHGN